MAVTGLYDAGPLIIARIAAKDTGAAFTTIESASILANSGEIKTLLPACLVMPGAVEPETRDNFHGLFDVTSTWHVSIIVPHIVDPDGVITTESTANSLTKIVIEALHQYRLSSDFPRYIKFVGADAYVYEIGYVEIPLYFETNVRLNFSDDANSG